MDEEFEMDDDYEDDILERMENDPESLIKEGYCNLFPIESASEKQRDNAKYVLTQCSNYYISIYWASERLKNDPAFVKEVVKLDDRTLPYVNRNALKRKTRHEIDFDDERSM